MLIADTSSQAEEYLAAVIAELETNEDLQRDYGAAIAPAMDWKGQPVAWRDREIVTAGGVTVKAYGAGKAIRGAKKREQRPDGIVIDDLENDESVRTVEQRDKLYDWLNGTVLNLGDVGTDVFYAGTVLHNDSVLARVLANPEWTTRKWKAIDDAGNPLWEAKWSRERLDQKRREIGSLMFAREYQNEPTAGGAGVFQDGWLVYRDSDGVAPYEDGWLTFAGFDPAISRRDGADYSALVTVARSPEDGRLYVRDAVHDRLSFREQATLLLRYCADVAALGIEAVAYQVVLAEELLRNTSLPVTPLKASKDKVTRAIQLSAKIESGKVVFDRYRHGDLIRELLDFPRGAHDDLVDALGYAVELADSRVKEVIEWL